MRLILDRTDMKVLGAAFSLVSDTTLRLTPAFIAWLRTEAQERKLKAIIIDYTAIRGARAGGGDVVKVESGEMGMLDQLGKSWGSRYC